MPIRPPLSTEELQLFPIGCIVALHCHPFFKDSHKDLVHVSGEPSMIPPLMIVAEVLMERKASFEEHTGLLISDEKTYQCRCIWFSLKSSQIEESWLSSKLIRRVDCKIDDEIESYIHGTTVVLKTSGIEIGKKKSTFKQFGKSEGLGNTITGLLSFTSPPMLIIGTVKNENKEPLIDLKTGKTKRWISKRLLKCKYYNPVSDKLSEVVIPIEALSKVTFVSKACIDGIEDKIEKGQLIEMDFNFGEITKTIIKPLKINYKGGFYFLEANDYLQNKVIEINIDGTEKQFERDGRTIDYLPKVDSTVSPMILYKINASNLEELPKNKFWRIKYRDNQGEITRRTIFSPTFVSIVPEEYDGSEGIIGVNNVRAKCILRKNEIRYFAIENILKLEVLDIDVPANLDNVS